MSQQILMKPETKNIVRAQRQIVSNQNSLIPNTQYSVTQSKIIAPMTPQKRVHEELLSVQNIVARVKRVFESRENENNFLFNQLQEKEKQLQYLEKQTRDHSRHLAQYSANIQVQKSKLLKIERESILFIEKDAEEAKSKINSLENETITAVRALSLFELNLRKALDMKDEMLAYMSQLEIEVTQMNEIILRDKEKINRYFEDITIGNEKIKELREKITCFNKKKEEIDKEIMDKQKALNEFNLAYDMMLTECKHHETMLSNVTTKYEKLIKESQQREIIITKTLTNSNTKITALREHINKIEYEIIKLKDDEEKRKKDYHLELSKNEIYIANQRNLNDEFARILKEKEELKNRMTKSFELKNTYENKNKDHELQLLTLEKLTLDLDIKNEANFKELAKGMKDLHDIRKIEPALLWELNQISKQYEDKKLNLEHSKKLNMNLILSYTKKHDYHKAANQMLIEINAMSNEDLRQNKIRNNELFQNIDITNKENSKIKTDTMNVFESLTAKQNIIEEINKVSLDIERKRSIILQIENEINEINENNEEIKNSISKHSNTTKKKVTIEKLTKEQKEKLAQDINNDYQTVENELVTKFEIEKSEIESNIQKISDKTKEIESKRNERSENNKKLQLKKAEIQNKVEELRIENEQLKKKAEELKLKKFSESKVKVAKSKSDEEVNTRKMEIKSKSYNQNTSQITFEPVNKPKSLEERKSVLTANKANNKSTISLKAKNIEVKPYKKDDNLNNDWMLDDDIFLGL